jgi:hypothetical protein
MEYPSHFASTYGSGSYNSSAYNSQTSAGASTGAATGSNILTNTGFDVAVGITLAAVIIFCALVVKFIRKPSKATPNSLTD